MILDALVTYIIGNDFIAKGEGVYENLIAAINSVGTW
jgi:hypothetical protein